MKDNYFYNNGELQRFSKINAVSKIETTTSVTAKLTYDFEHPTQECIVLSKVMYLEFWQDAVYQHFPDITFTISYN
jgi:hypothetical protein